LQSTEIPIKLREGETDLYIVRPRYIHVKRFDCIASHLDLPPPKMSSTAFVTGAASVARPYAGQTTSSFTQTSATPSLAAAKKHGAATIRMDMEPKFKVNDKPLAKQSFKESIINPDDNGGQIPQGFTLFSERLNGQGAMIGIIAAFGAELLNPAHPTVVQQLHALFSGLAQALQI
jgi:hypothetical protein